METPVALMVSMDPSLYWSRWPRSFHHNLYASLTAICKHQSESPLSLILSHQKENSTLSHTHTTQPQVFGSRCSPFVLVACYAFAPSHFYTLASSQLPTLWSHLSFSHTTSLHYNASLHSTSCLFFSMLIIISHCAHEESYYYIFNILF